ncbi:lipase secretion chaperone [Burkholderia sp. BCC1999]|uniref:lipase secretion chaperone n=1 Tax=Burkholderia sp. BCC1999 TaxID=2817448 RepID=UPI002AC31F1A|nr:lipase secretion chaperone [Burkholderia sp. BCC1999]
MKVRTILSGVVLHGAVGTLAASTVWYALDGPASSTHTVALPAARAVVPDAAGPQSGPAAPDAAPPGALAGSRAPRLPLGPDGRLAKVRTVRDFFDYFLLAQHDLTPAALDALVAREVAAQPIGIPAQREALGLWPRYRACLAALDAQPGATQPGTRIDPDAIAGELERRAALASRWLGDWSKPFFGDDFRQQRDDLDRIRIARDPALSDAQKRERLAALDQSLPPDMRDAHERLTQQRETLATVARLDAQRVAPDALRAQLGADIAARVVRLWQDDDAWQARYRDHAAERERLAAQQLAPDARDAQLAQLLQRDFPDPADASRAASLDADSASVTARRVR